MIKQLPSLGFIGAGTVGTALALRLSQKGYPVMAVSSRRYISAQNLADRIEGCRAYTNNQSVADASSIVFITTPDSAIGPVVERIKWHSGQSVIHCSGADSTDILSHARDTGACTGVLHPLQTFASISQAIENIPGSTFGIEAEEPLLSTLKDMASALEGRWVELNAEDKVLYHASAVLVSNYLVTLVKLAADLWKTFDIPSSQAVAALLPLLRGTLNNIENVGIPQALTGPIARGDTGTVEKHLEALAEKAPGLLSAYCELGKNTIPLALAKGKIDREKALELNALLEKGRICHAYNVKE